jgi:hypothetical protein
VGTVARTSNVIHIAVNDLDVLVDMVARVIYTAVAGLEMTLDVVARAVRTDDSSSDLVVGALEVESLGFD